MKIWLTTLFLVTPILVNAQSSAEKLRETREKTLKEIEYANQLLKETEGKTKQSLNEISIINHRLSKRRELLIGLEVEVNMLTDEISKNQKDISSVEAEIAKVKAVYANMIYNLYKNKSSNYSAMYFLASDNVNQLYKRIHTVKLYNNYLKQERQTLEDLKERLQKQSMELEQLKQNKDQRLSQTRQEALSIQKEVNEKNRLVSQLKKRQKEIQDDIRKKELTARKLENEIRRIIEEERKKSVSSSGPAMTPEERIVSGDFEKNSGKLPWPTERGIIIGKFGKHPHPDYKNVMIRNDGIYISTTEGANARTIFKGTVSRVFKIPGENYSVIIKHGRYFTLYHNLVNVKVKAGQTVNTKEVIGTVYTDQSTKETILYFLIYNDTEKSDPEIWLAPM